MLLRYFYEDKLAQASYFVGCQSTGEAIVVDPARDVVPYLVEARAQGMRIVATTETHIHADFVSGARELAEGAGATLYLSDEGDKDWKYSYAAGYRHMPLHDGDIFHVGNLKFETLHTPGHTPEHIALLVTDTRGADRPMGVFTGDFVFVGDVGRPDLLEKAAGLADTAEASAREMFRSLQRFRELPDFLQLWPGHGAGSACGKDLGAVPTSTVGYEKLFNWALNQNDEAAFTSELLAGQPEPPRYFTVMKRVNKAGPPVLRGLPVAERLPSGRLEAIMGNGSTVVDTRPAAAFASAHIPGTINIPHDSSFTNWAGWLLDYDRPFYLIHDHSAAEEVARDLLSIGLDNCAGYFETAAIMAWAAAGHELQTYKVATAQQAAKDIQSGAITLIDVRNQDEWAGGHIPGARHIMLGYLAERAGEIPADKPVMVQCVSGARSAIGASILQAKGILAVANLTSGIDGWSAAGLPVTRD
jgi:hydroxyacylglutathione hydrolase